MLAYLKDEKTIDEVMASPARTLFLSAIPDKWFDEMRNDPHVKFYLDRSVSRGSGENAIYEIRIIYMFENTENNKLKGLTVIPMSKWVSGYAVTKYDEKSLDDGYALGDIEHFENMTFHEVVDRFVRELNICDICHKPVGYGNLHRYSFAGKCCKDCLPAAREKFEQPGWYN